MIEEDEPRQTASAAKIQEARRGSVRDVVPDTLEAQGVLDLYFDGKGA